jgi:hydrogenase nickel incorporation protein HypB
MVQIKVESNILGANELIARQNRNNFKQKGILAINIMSSPGAGKTTILERTLDLLRDKINLAVIEGDLYTDQDAARIAKHGIEVVQINTGGTCHLDAGMIGRAFNQLKDKALDCLIIENVGNLVCPAEFDLGEDCRVVVASTAEGNDKILKYPLIFHQARVILLNKIDLLELTDFDIERFKKDLGEINPEASLFLVSGRSGEGLEDWAEWLLGQIKDRSAI